VREEEESSALGLTSPSRRREWAKQFDKWQWQQL